MYEYVRIHYRQIKHRLSAFFTRRFLPLILGFSFALVTVFQTPLTRSAVTVPYLISASGIFKDTLPERNTFSQVSFEQSSFSALVNPGNYSSVSGEVFFSFPFPVYFDPSDRVEFFFNFNPDITSTDTYSVTIIFYLVYRQLGVGTGSISRTITYTTSSRFNNNTSNIFDLSGWNNNNFNYLYSAARIYFFISGNFSSAFTSGAIISGGIGSTFPLNSSSNIPEVSIPGTPATEQTVSDFENANSELMSEFDDYSNYEQQFTDDFKNAERALNSEFTGWTWGALTQGTTWLSTQLTNFYNYSGDFKQLIVYPLLAGVALVFLGRWGSVRSSKRAHDKRIGGDSS